MPEDSLDNSSSRAEIERFLRIGSFAWLIFALHYLLLGRFLTVSIDLLVAVLTWRLRQSLTTKTSPSGILNLAVLYSTAGLTVAALISGQSQSMAVWFLTAVPVVAGFLLGARQAVLWTIAAAFCAVLVDASELIFKIPPEFVPQGWELTGGRILLLLLILGFTTVFRRNSDMQIQKLRQQRLDLEHARVQLERVENERQALLSVAKHEFRTPLNSMIGFSQILQSDSEGSLNSVQRRYLQNIEASAEHLHHLLDGMLETTASDGSDLLTAEFQLWPLFTELEQDLSRAYQARDSKLTLEVDIEPKTLVINSNRERLHKILRQLLDHAVKFTDKETILLQATLAGSNVVVSLSDAGPGLEIQEFQRGGYGVGLTLVKHWTEELGIRMDITKNESTGSNTIRLHFPTQFAKNQPQ